MSAPDRLYVEVTSQASFACKPQPWAHHNAEYVHADLYDQAIRERDEAMAALAADAARLDWMQARLTGASDSERYLPFRVYWGQTRNIRAAIDKAMEPTWKDGKA